MPQNVTTRSTDHVPVNKDCGDFIPVSSLSNDTNLVSVDREKVEPTQSTSAEIYESYFVMYIWLALRFSQKGTDLEQHDVIAR